MIKEFAILDNAERALLLKAPVLVSVLASYSYNEINKARKGEAIKLSHLKTYTANPLLLSYYTEVEKTFKPEFEAAVEKYYPFDDVKRNELKNEIKKIDHIISKLGNEFAHILRKSLHGYAAHVKKAAHSIFQDFIFPIHIDGLSEY